MSKKQEEKIDNEELNTQSASEETTDTSAQAQAQEAEAADEEVENDAQKPAEESLDDKINKLTEDLEKANKEYLFLLANSTTSASAPCAKKPISYATPEKKCSGNCSR